MSIKVKIRLEALGIETTHEERVALDAAIEEKTGKYCDIGVEEFTDEEFKALLENIRKRRPIPAGVA